MVPIEAISVHVERWATKIPFRITGLSRTAFDVIVVEISDGAHVGRGEGLPVHYLGETIDQLCQSIEELGAFCGRTLEPTDILEHLPSGGARNALDSALLDLAAKRQGSSVWAMIDLAPKPLATAFTIGIEDDVELTAKRAREAGQFSILKIKVDHDRPLERVAAVRAARPGATLVVDANRAWSFDMLTELAPRLSELGVAVIEQPLDRGHDDMLEDYRSPVPLCADESCQDESELEIVARRYQMLNIKLDKAGGLRAGLRLARAARGAGLGVWAGNMGGTSLSMAPTFALAQLCDFAELDGPLLLKHDRLPAMRTVDGIVHAASAALWG